MAWLVHSRHIPIRRESVRVVQQDVLYCLRLARREGEAVRKKSKRSPASGTKRRKVLGSSKASRSGGQSLKRGLRKDTRKAARSGGATIAIRPIGNTRLRVRKPRAVYISRGRASHITPDTIPSGAVGAKK